MKSTTKKPQTIDEYISMHPSDIREILQNLRQTIGKSAPSATEKISYQMPTFYYHGNLVHFAVCKNHIGFYPTPSGIIAFQKELESYMCTKGSIHFPLSAAMPYELISRIVQFRMNENRK